MGILNLKVFCEEALQLKVSLEVSLEEAECEHTQQRAMGSTQRVHAGLVLEHAFSVVEREQYEVQGLVT